MNCSLSRPIPRRSRRSINPEICSDDGNRKHWLVLPNMRAHFADTICDHATVAGSGLPRSADFSPLPSGSPEIAGSGLKSALRPEISSQSAAQASSLYRKSGGRPVKPPKNTGPKVPSGTTDSSPRFQPWVAGAKRPEPRRGERTNAAEPTRSFVPDGTRFIFAPQPSDESLGYSRASLRDVDSQHAKHVLGGTPTRAVETTALPSSTASSRLRQP